MIYLFLLLRVEHIKNSPDLPCSISGSISISFSISNYTTSIVPTWVSVNSSFGILTIITPEVIANTEYDFYISSIIDGVSDPVQKLIKLTILNWVPDNWQKCTSTSATICETCNFGYYLSSNGWQTSSETAQTLSTVTTSVVVAITRIVVFTSLINTSSIANLWMTVNQLQLFFLIYWQEHIFQQISKLLSKALILHRTFTNI